MAHRVLGAPPTPGECLGVLCQGWRVHRGQAQTLDGMFALAIPHKSTDYGRFRRKWLRRTGPSAWRSRVLAG